MPHVIVKLAAGWSDAKKAEIAERFTHELMTVLDHDAEAVSIVIEDIPVEDWMAQIYGPEIAAKQASLFKRPGYGPLADGTAPSHSD